MNIQEYNHTNALKPTDLKAIETTFCNIAIKINIIMWNYNSINQICERYSE